MEKPVIISVFYLEDLKETKLEEVKLLLNPELWTLTRILKQIFIFLKKMKEEEKNHSLMVTDLNFSWEQLMLLVISIY